MYVIAREGHIGFWWDGDTKLFVEEQSVICPSRSDCLDYLQQFHPKDKAIEIIVDIKKSGGKSILSF